jgi:hypothetical protein
MSSVSNCSSPPDNTMDSDSESLAKAICATKPLAHV